MPDDIFLLQTSGIPLFAKCIGGDYCKMHPNHSLQTGFLAAMYNFSKESIENKIVTRGAMGDIHVEERKKPLWKRFVSRFKREK